MNAAPNGAVAFDDTATLATALQAAGYRTGLMGKYLNDYDKLWTSGQAPYVPPGWDDWRVFQVTRNYGYTLIENGASVAYGYNSTSYATDVLRAKAVQFIDDSVAAAQPFFLTLSVYSPHTPAQPATRHVGSFAGLLPFRPPSYNEADVSDKPSWFSAYGLFPATKMAETDAVRIGQLEMLQSVDEAVGGNAALGITGVMDALRAHQIQDQTIVIFMSDNGFLWGEHRLRAKPYAYDEDLRVPMLVRYPRLVPLARVEDGVALTIDVAPTVAELAGAPSPGRSTA
jgi:arylsulfatase A-like enzyme